MSSSCQTKTASFEHMEACCQILIAWASQWALDCTTRTPEPKERKLSLAPTAGSSLAAARRSSGEVSSVPARAVEQAVRVRQRHHAARPVHPRAQEVRQL